jgi:excisionase family DNA binding protein
MISPLDPQEARTMKRITEAAAEIGVSPTTLRRWVRAGRVPVVRTPAGRWFWTEAQLRTIRQMMGAEAGGAVVIEA